MVGIQTYTTILVLNNNLLSIFSTLVSSFLICPESFSSHIRSPTDEVPIKSPKNRAGIGQKKVNLINGIIVSVLFTLTTLNKTINSQ